LLSLAALGAAGGLGWMTLRPRPPNAPPPTTAALAHEDSQPTPVPVYTPPPAAPPSPVALSIDSTPAGVVFVDRARRGKTPLELHDLQAGRAYDVEVRAPGHQPTRSILSLAPGEKRQLSLTLKPEPPRRR
jgi:hypothetical protein